MSDLDKPSTSGLQTSFSCDFITNEESEEEIIDSEEELQIHLSDEDSDSEFSDSFDIQHPVKRKRGHRETERFAWTDSTFVPKIHQFEVPNSGINHDYFHPDETTREVDFFKRLFSENIVTSIVIETNRYAAQYLLANPTLPKRSLMSTWTDTTVGEIYLFIALCMLMVQSKKLKVSNYWSTDWLLRSEQFPKLMSRDRFLVLLRMLHFCDNRNQPDGDRLFKISEIRDMFLHNFKSILIPFQNLSINESLVLFKGKFGFKQYIKTKQHRCGIVLFVLCDVNTGFVLDVIIYTGKETDIDVDADLEFSGSVVMKMLEPYLDKGYSLYMDSWYTSPVLSNELHTRKTNSCGTVKAQRKHMPKFERQKIPRGSKEMKATENMMVVKWQDKRQHMLLTTIHHDEMRETRKLNFRTNKPIMKPECLIAYDGCMGSVDQCNLLLSSIECVRKSTKWYKKLFFHFVDISLLNACSLYKLHVGKKIPIAAFQLEVIRQLAEQNSMEFIRRPIGRPLKRADMPTRLKGRHFLTAIPATKNVPNPQRRCRVCSQTTQQNRKKRQTRYLCQQCDVPLCVLPCFEVYHTQKIF